MTILVNINLKSRLPNLIHENPIRSNRQIHPKRKRLQNAPRQIHQSEKAKLLEGNSDCECRSVDDL